MILPKKLSYYQRNKDKYKKGGKYYKYIPKDLQNRDLKFAKNANRSLYGS